MRNEGFIIFSLDIDSDICSKVYIVPVSASPEDYEFFNEKLKPRYDIPLLGVDFLRELLRFYQDDEENDIYNSPIFVAPISVSDYDNAEGDHVQKVIQAATFRAFEGLSDDTEEPKVITEEFYAVIISGIRGEKLDAIPKNNFVFVNPIIHLVNEKMNIPGAERNANVFVGIGELPLITPVELLIEDEEEINASDKSDNDFILHPFTVEDAIQNARLAVKENEGKHASDDRVIYYGTCIALAFNMTYGASLEMIRRYIDILDTIETLPISSSAKTKVKNIMPRPCYVLDNFIKRSELARAVEASKNIMGITPEMTYTDFEKMLGGII